MKLITLTKGYSAKVDDSWFDYLNQWKWHYNTGYAERKEKGKHVQVHRVVKGINGLIDHKNGDTLDNQEQNLRVSNHSTNAMNMRKHRGASKYKGVSREGNIWRTQIWKDNEKVFSVSCKEERWAGMIYDLNAPALFGGYARLNFPNALSKGLTAGELLVEPQFP